MTTVLNLYTGEHLIYTLPPAEAVVAAFERDRGNGNTWDYANLFGTHPELSYGPSGRTVFCGPFGALIDSQ